MLKKLLNTKETADILSVSEAFLERDRWAGARIPFIKVGARAIRYRMQDIEQYIEDNLSYSTSEVEHA
ncbi:helix-turn-helix domain-containing protein [Colwellia sp. MB02u-18]|jgi:predicted DNA-binding transcriptional regulator AlpA|uniref:helix-turn-helix transcriptional regulator n=1 Tax=unclassified Colwellia TaxID=196834 RepID=UPI0015F3C16A|nr:MULTISPECIES: helix-turn-helix domain-containing protein [unclassified Colwellia]MBA6224729.1 helix-turn-helix domain-containing protein [Colwellia sp. MB3u-45]MBA6266819.1 helix-turn-helix domain-containing protein [Colwellia sp. MB3u-43]MBA6321414.1 helix-turn-helix domain-containing protein [Colwellia sp. MB02u-19]MBA6323621.1 helix-turn-helix domain-containing protein [Colwellia sp. MB02u-18]MBA6332442.1 helix-turn-helix domain-containing protein [Colwellia sp. MB02u-12]